MRPYSVFVLLLVIIGSIAEEDLPEKNVNFTNYFKEIPSTVHIQQDLATPQVSGFNSPQVKSGPIVMVNKQQMFISEFKLQGQTGASFYAGNDCSVDLGPAVENTLYVNLTGDMTVFTMSFLCVKSAEEVLAKVEIKFVGDVPNFTNKTDTGEIMRLPKCCQINNSYINTTCVPNIIDLSLNVTVYNHNETCFDDEPMNTSEFTFIPYYNPNYTNCDLRIPLDPEYDKFSLLRNGSLIVVIPGDLRGILSHSRFCIENVDMETSIFVCLDPKPKTAAISDTIYFILLFVSMVCYFVVAGLYYFILYNQRDIHQRLFTVYAVLMGLNSVIHVLIYWWPNTFCSFAVVIQFLLFTSFIWILILCFDVLVLIEYFLDYSKIPKQRFSIYSALALIVASVFVGVCFLLFNEPNLPSGIIRIKDGGECAVQEGNKFLFSIPSFLLLLGSLGCLLLFKWNIYKNNKNKELETDFSWINEKQRYNFLCRAYFLIICLMSVWILLGLLEDYLTSSIKITMQLLLSLQGVIFMCISCLHKPIRCRIKLKLAKKKYPIIPAKFEMESLSKDEN